MYSSVKANFKSRDLSCVLEIHKEKRVY